MKKRVFSQSLLASIAIFAMMTLQSCQSCQKKPADPCNPPPPAKPECREQKACVEEEASEEAMTHVIEIDQPATPNVSEEKSSVQPAAETPMEASSVPTPSHPEQPAVETISSVESPTDILELTSTPATAMPELDTMSSVSVTDAVETTVIEILDTDSSNQE